MDVKDNRKILSYLDVPKTRNVHNKISRVAKRFSLSQLHIIYSISEGHARIPNIYLPYLPVLHYRLNLRKALPDLEGNILFSSCIISHLYLFPFRPYWTDERSVVLDYPLLTQTTFKALFVKQKNVLFFLFLIQYPGIRDCLSLCIHINL